MTRFKPGQLVTIDHTVYRIRNAKNDTCAQCTFDTPVTSPQPAICRNCVEELGWNGYLEKVCGKQDS